MGVIFSEALSDAGAGVMCADIDSEGVEKTADTINASGRKALAISADVTNEAQVVAMVEASLSQFGRMDIIVNNAGIAAAGPPEDLSLDDWKRVIDVNLTGVFLGAREAAKVMIASGHGGRIINIASILGGVASQPVPAAAYAASKGGVVNLTRDLAVHWAAHGITVNAIGPAYFPSAMTEGFLADPQILAAVEQRTPMGRVGRPEELKGPVVFLASDASSYVTGQTLYVDGGWTAW
ncbi:glucose 1-dehydrogenase [soil metagenome]